MAKEDGNTEYEIELQRQMDSALQYHAFCQDARDRAYDEYEKAEKELRKFKQDPTENVWK